jgi:hypothetical protein
MATRAIVGKLALIALDLRRQVPHREPRWHAVVDQKQFDGLVSIVHRRKFDPSAPLAFDLGDLVVNPVDTI